MMEICLPSGGGFEVLLESQVARDIDSPGGADFHRAQSLVEPIHHLACTDSAIGETGVRA